MMKKFILLFLFFGGLLFSQENITTHPGRIVVKKPSKDITPPVITILEPLLQNNSCTSRDSLLQLKGIAVDDNGTEKVYINNRLVEVKNGNEFSSAIKLLGGGNIILISAEDKNKNKSTIQFTVNYISDSRGPVVQVISPLLNINREFNSDRSTVQIKGVAIDENGIESIDVNNSNVDVLNGRDFSANLNLTEGKNKVIIKALDKNKNQSAFEFFVHYNLDNEGPIIAILSPPAARGSKVISKKEVETIMGTAADKSGVAEVLVNNKRAVLNDKNEFSVDMYLTVGENKIIVKSSDLKNNTSIDTFFIERKLEDVITTGKYYALIIGIDDYEGDWTKLRNAVNDAKAVEDLISTSYKFDDIITLYNEDATRRNIIQKFETLTSKVNKDDNVLIFYSGHGEFKQQLNKGYWVPVDAKTKSTADYISNSDIQTYLNGINSKHTLLVADACFSGDIFRGRTDELPFEDSEKYFKEVYKRASRSALTSGGIEPVTDGGRDGHSVFTYYFLKALKENNSKYFTAGQVFNFLNIPVTNNSEQSPVFQPIKNTGDEGGQFVFIKK